MSYRVAVRSFEGPLDLLLQLIENQKLEITTVAIAEVTGEYLTYLDKLENATPARLNWFIEIASKLIYIKSRALVPSISEDDDSAAELTAQIAEYQRYKQAATRLRELQHERGMSYERTPAKPVLGTTMPANLELGALQASMQAIIRRLPEEPSESIAVAITLEEMTGFIMQRLQQGPVSLQEATAAISTKADAIVFFIALLELIKQAQVTAGQSELFDDIIIEATS